MGFIVRGAERMKAALERAKASGGAESKRLDISSSVSSQGQFHKISYLFAPRRVYLYYSSSLYTLRRVTFSIIRSVIPPRSYTA